MAERMQYNGAGASARVIPPGAAAPGTRVRSRSRAQRVAAVPVTGLSTTGAEVYGGQYISYVKLAAGQAVTIPLK